MQKALQIIESRVLSELTGHYAMILKLTTDISNVNTTIEPLKKELEDTRKQLQDFKGTVKLQNDLSFLNDRFTKLERKFADAETNKMYRSIAALFWREIQNAFPGIKKLGKNLRNNPESTITQEDEKQFQNVK